MSEQSQDHAVRTRVFYRLWLDIPVRFGDQDVLGHVNNTAIASYFETARCSLVIPEILPGAPPRLNVVLARIEIDYLHEINFPSTVAAGANVVRIGEKSFAVASGLFVGEACCAVAEATLVFFDTVTRRSCQPTPEARQRLAALGRAAGAVDRVR